MLAAKLDVEVCWFSYDWEKKGGVSKIPAYILKSISTLGKYLKERPARIFAQLPPSPLLYITYIYSKLFKCQVIFDCHNSLFCAHWVRWPLVKNILNSKNVVTLSHNVDICEIAKGMGVETIVLQTPPTKPRVDAISQTLPCGLAPYGYVIVPLSFSDDEPVEELFSAARQTSEITYVITWSKHLESKKETLDIPGNVVFTGFLEESLYEVVFVNALCAIALTDREGTQPSVASEAIGFGVPLVISDIATTRKLYAEWPIYVNNKASSIAEGVEVVASDREAMVPRMRGLLDRISMMHETQFSNLMKKLDNSL